MIKLVAFICSLAIPTDCRNLTVASSANSDLTMQGCLMAAPQVAEWMNKEHPAERLASWKCIIGKAPEHA